MTRLRVSPDLTLPDDAVTHTFAIFGKRGSGKSNTGVVLAEEMYRAGAPFVVLDPISAWWGIKSSFDGSGPGLPVYVFGGPHADMPLQPDRGELMARVFIEHRVPMVLDMKGWGTAERARFVTAFAAFLLGHNDRVPSHVFLEEADAFVPQRPMKGEETMLGTIDRLVRWGRQEGLGASLITQRSAKVNKDVTTQADTLIAHRTIGPQDRDAIEEWIKFHADGPKRHEILASLATLPDGTAWVWSPEWLEVLKQVSFRRRETYDSAGTPKLGEKRVAPKRLAEVDLDRLRGQLAEVEEEAKADDPRELRKRIRELEAAAAKPAPAPETVEKIVEVPILEEGQADVLRTVVADLRSLDDTLGSRIIAMRGMADDIIAAIDRAATAPRSARPAVSVSGAVVGRSPEPVHRRRLEEVAAGVPPAQRGRAGAEPGEGSLGKAERAILGALAAYEFPLSREQLAFLADYHPRTPGFANALGALRTAGLVAPDWPSALTEAGEARVLAGEVEAVPAPPLDAFLDRLASTKEKGYEAMVASLHLEPEEYGRFVRRLSEDRLAAGTVVS